MKIIESSLLVQQFRFPRTKKRRIRKKWALRPENNRPAQHALRMGDTLICHPVFAHLLRSQTSK